MNSKEKCIAEAYKSHGYDWEEIKEVVSQDGWGNCRLFHKLALSGKQEDSDCGYYVRPLELQGIENNNGWIKIESEDDLPKGDYNQYHVITKSDIYCEIPKNQNIEEFWGNDINKSAWWMENISHYQPIDKPHKPIY